MEPSLFEAGCVIRSGGLTLRSAEAAVLRANQGLQLFLLLITQNGGAVFKRFDPEIAELGAVFLGFLELAFNLNQIGRRLLHEARDFFFDAGQLLLNGGHLALIVATNVF